MTHTPWVPSAPHLLLRGVGTPGWVRPRSPQRPGEVGTEAPPGEAQQQTGPGTHVSPVRPREPQPRVGGGRGARRDRPLPAGSQTSAGHVPPSPSPSWRPRRSTCSWRPPAARPCPAWPCSSPRACPPRSCTRCQVGRAGPNPSGAEAAPRCQSGPESKTGHGVGWGRGRWGQVGCRGGLRSAPASPPAAQMVITDLSAPEERPAALGRLGLCFGVGTILGSLLGGTLSSACG